MSDRKTKLKIKRTEKQSTVSARRVAQSWSAYCCPFKLGYPHVAIAVTPSYWRNSTHVVLLTLYGRSRNCLRHCWRQSTPMRQVTSHVAPGIDLPLWRHLSSLAFRLTLSGAAATTRGNALPLLLFTPSALRRRSLYDVMNSYVIHARICVFVCERVVPRGWCRCPHIHSCLYMGKTENGVELMSYRRQLHKHDLLLKTHEWNVSLF